LYPAQRIVHVLVSLAQARDDRAEVQEAADQHLAAGLRGGEDRARPVRRREDQRLVPRLREVAGRGAHVESLDDDRVAFPAEHPFSKLGLQRACLVDLRAARERAANPQPALGRSSRWRARRRRRPRRRRLPTRPE